MHRIAWIAVVLPLLAVAALPARAQEAAAQPAGTQPAVTQPVAVLELFTSQGCSSCPAADEVLAAHADRDDVLALAWHVDYWDYLGWQDTLAMPAHAERQRAYAKRMGEGVYTPQIVVNGIVEGVGHRGDAVADMIRSATRAAALVPLAVRRSGMGYHVSLAAADGPARRRVEAATLFLVWYSPRDTVPIRHGENKGREMVYRNSVQGMQMLGSVADGRLEVVLSLAAMRRAMPRGLACALVLQRTVDGLPGPILAAAKIGALSSR